MTTSIPGKIAGLAGRLTQTQDRETYTELMCYLNALPPNDEFRRLAEMFGLIALMGQRLPDSMAEFLGEMIRLSERAEEYYGRVDERLAALPQEITDGVDPTALAKALGESFRQQIAAVGLQDTASLLRSSAGDINALSGQIATTIKPAILAFHDMSATISSELGKLTEASARLRQSNETLFEKEQTNAWLWQSMCALVLLLAGVIIGITWEEQRTADTLRFVGAQLGQIQKLVSASTEELPKNSRRQKGSR